MQLLGDPRHVVGTGDLNEGRTHGLSPVGAFSHHGHIASLNSQIPKNLSHQLFRGRKPQISNIKPVLAIMAAKLGFGAGISSRPTTVIYVAVTI